MNNSSCLIMSLCGSICSILPASLSPAHKAPQCGQSRRLQLRWHNGVFHPSSPLPGSTRRWARCGGGVWSMVGWVNNPTHITGTFGSFLDFFFVCLFLLQSTHLCQCSHVWLLIPESTFVKASGALYPTHTLFLFYSILPNKVLLLHDLWHIFSYMALHRTDTVVGFSFVLLCGRLF